MNFQTVPSWAVPKTRRMAGVWGTWTDMNKKNVERLHAAEKKGKLDVVLYGDSITSFHFGYTISNKDPGTDKLWKKHFAGLNAVPMAIPGDKIDQVVWRLMKGGEKPQTAPKTIAFLIGINDCTRNGEDLTKPRNPPTIDRMDYLLGWVKQAFPSSSVIVCALTPTTGRGRSARNALNKDYKTLVEKYAANGMSIRFADCSSSFSKADGLPMDASYLTDTVHLSTKAHDIFLKNLRIALDTPPSSSVTASTPTTATTTATAPVTSSDPKSSKGVVILLFALALCMMCASLGMVSLTMPH